MGRREIGKTIRDQKQRGRNKDRAGKFSDYQLLKDWSKDNRIKRSGRSRKWPIKIGRLGELGLQKLL